MHYQEMLSDGSCCIHELIFTVIFNLLGHVVVDDMLDLWEIKALGGNIGGYQHILLVILKGLDSVLTFLLSCPMY